MLLLLVPYWMCWIVQDGHMKEVKERDGECQKQRAIYFYIDYVKTPILSTYSSHFSSFLPDSFTSLSKHPSPLPFFIYLCMYFSLELSPIIAKTMTPTSYLLLSSPPLWPLPFFSLPFLVFLLYLPPSSFPSSSLSHSFSLSFSLSLSFVAFLPLPLPLLRVWEG